jgi:hypothetical protein
MIGRIVLDRAGVGNLLKSAEMSDFVNEQAARVRDAIGGDWTVDEQRVNKNRVVTEVSTLDPKAHWSEAESGRISSIVKGMNI